MNRKIATWTGIAFLSILLLALLSATGYGQAMQDTSYVLGPNIPDAYTPEKYLVTRRDSVMGQILRTTAGSDSTRPWIGQAPGWFAGSWQNLSTSPYTSKNDAAHAVVLNFNSLHPLPVVMDTVVTPTPTGYDTTYTQTRVDCPSTTFKTCYIIRQNGVQAGRVYQYDTSASRRWEAGRGTVAFAPLYTTLKAAARRVIDDWHITYIPPTPVDTTHKTIVIYDTTHVKVVIYDTTHVPVVIYDTTHAPTPAAAVPELPRHMDEMDAMLRSARASDTITRQYFDMVGKTLVARKDSLGRFVCGNIVQVDSAGQKWEKPVTFPCPQAVVDAVAARNAKVRAQSDKLIPIRKSTVKPRIQ